jgi:thiopeptide-type bacteriocin biosynthesis protein
VFIMRKPPGIRLRVLGATPALSLGAELDDLVRRRVVSRWSTSVYEPESRLFGGEHCTALVHDHFDADSIAALEWELLAATGATSISRDVLAMAVVNDLFTAAIADRSEIWDAWCNLAETHRMLRDVGGAEPLPAITLSSLLPLVGPREAAIVRRYGRANDRLAKGVRALWSKGRLGRGVRAILPFVALFHWNRHGLTPASRRRILHGMVAAHDPAREMRGRDAAPPAAVASAGEASS